MKTHHHHHLLTVEASASAAPPAPPRASTMTDDDDGGAADPCPQAVSAATSPSDSYGTAPSFENHHPQLQQQQQQQKLLQHEASPLGREPRRKRERGRGASLALSFVRLVFVEGSLTILFGLLVSTYVAERLAVDYLLPQIQLQKFDWESGRRENEVTYYHRKCTVDDLSARDTAELVVGPSSSTTTTPREAARHMNVHGAQVHPNLLSEETAKEVRDFVLRQNEKNEDMIFVIEPNNRWSFGMRVDQDPSIPKALKEILSNEFLVDSIEEIMGKDPAVIEFTAITSAYGAAIQRYHADVVPEGNGAKWSRNFVPSYSLFIPLQNTTSAMGATDICPGSHMCSDGCFDYCPTDGFQVSGKADNWPMGWGALVNQQTMHRGAAHVDPNGPHRVVFIITFAPRPQFGENQVETRMIGQGGSYSLHWTQWGHTLSDFRDSDRYMQQPWRTLRSFGFYKPPGRRWGWDWFSQSTGRIANNELGFYYDDLVKMMAVDVGGEGGGLPGIPRKLQGEIPPHDEGSEAVWVKFYSDTLKKCRQALIQLNVVAGVTYLALVIGCSFIFSSSSSRRHAMNVFSGVARLAAGHALVLLVAWYCIKRADNSTWGKNVRSGRLYTWPELPHALAPALQTTTLPTLDDIMIFDDMQSEYMASFNDVLDVFHPGNKAWSRMVSDNSAGYDSLPAALQTHVCKSMLDWSFYQQGRRVLVKNAESQWARSDSKSAIRFCHKEMMKQANPFVKQAIRQIDFQMTECKFGFFRDASMHQNYRYIPGRLIELQDRIMGFSSPVRSKSESGPFTGIPKIASPIKKSASTSTAGFLVHCRISRPLLDFPTKLIPQRTSSFPPEPKIDSSKWIEQGDDVEATYGDFMYEFYRGTVRGASAARMTWNIEYDDGDFADGVCSECVRHFVPYREGEKVDCQTADGAYEPGSIKAVYANDEEGFDATYDVKINDSNRVLKGVTTSDLRRSIPLLDDVLKVGSRVLSKYPGTDEMYPGVIAAVSKARGTIEIQFDDGDYLEGVDPYNVRPIGN